MKDLVKKMLAGDRRALARLLSVVEQRDDTAFDLLEQIWSHTGRALTVGITGPAGAGKSTLIDQLIVVLRDQAKKVGVIAVDPSSPFSGGAVLGDRVRMQRHSVDPEVFIRSVGNRGKPGGVSLSTRALMQILDAFGREIILVETVGAGQAEVDIASIVQTTVVVLGPEAGDTVQTLKAGILEIADIFVVNKKDRDGADRIAREIESMLSLAPPKEWMPPVLLLAATNGEGVEDLWAAIVRHTEHRTRHPVSPVELARRRAKQLREIVEARVSVRIGEEIEARKAIVERLEKDETPNLYAMAEELLKDAGRFAP